ADNAHVNTPHGMRVPFQWPRNRGNQMPSALSTAPAMNSIGIMLPILTQRQGCQTSGLSGAGPGTLKCKQKPPTGIHSRPLVRRHILQSFLIENHSAMCACPYCKLPRLTSPQTLATNLAVRRSKPTSRLKVGGAALGAKTTQLSRV